MVLHLSPDNRAERVQPGRARRRIQREVRDPTVATTACRLAFRPDSVLHQHHPVTRRSLGTESSLRPGDRGGAGDLPPRIRRRCRCDETVRCCATAIRTIASGKARRVETDGGHRTPRHFDRRSTPHNLRFLEPDRADMRRTNGTEDALSCHDRQPVVCWQGLTG